MALGAARKNGVTVILVTQRPRALNTVDKILRLHGGSVDFFGSRQEFVARLKELKQKAMQQRAARQPAAVRQSTTHYPKNPPIAQGNQPGSIVAHHPVNPVVQTAFGSHIKVQNER
jgi:ATP-binding cassette subfamily C protein